MPVPIDTSFLDHLPQNVAVQFLDRVRASGSAEAFRFPRGDAWESVTWDEAGARVRRLAAGLVALGVTQEQRVGIASNTRYEWVLADLAVMCAGGATTTVYPSTNAEDTAYILSDSDSHVVFAEDAEQLAKLRERRAELPALTKVVAFSDHDGGPAGDDDADDWVISMDTLAALGDERLAAEPGLIDDIAASIQPDQLATLIYTSGTTGKPKGVRLKHRSWVYEGEAIKAQGILDETDLQFLWLPMAHSFGKVLLSTQMACGFATAIDGRVDRIVDNLGVVKPTFMGAAPRIFEKAHGRIVTMTASEGGAKKKIFDQAFKVGLEVDRRRREGQSIPLPLKAQHAVFDKLVFSKVRERFGGRVRFFISGSAALNGEIAGWFHAAGILILEGYGLTENAAGASVGHPSDYKIGTVGHAMPGSEIRIGEGDEVQVRGPHVMDGYHNLPEETAATLTEDGWLRTGDKGSLDADGFLTITGRIKDLFKTSGGKYVAPSDYKIGTVGHAMPGSEIRIGEGDEVQVRGPHVMDGYHNLPEETAATLTEDGWLRTGDKGSLDADGFLTITGRIKDLFKTSGGKYIAPSAIESKFKALCPYTSQFVVFGNERNFVVALITLDPDAMATWAEENGMGGSSYTEIVSSEKVHAMVGDYVEQLNERLNRWETIKKWEILDHDLSIESGELTPSMKVKRNVVEDNHQQLISSFYTA